MQLIIAIAAGGALGSVLRHLTTSHAMQFWGGAFPYGTFIVNAIGSLLMGVVIGMLAKYFDGNQLLRAFLTIGLLGGYTTFSAFALDSIVLIERGDWISAVIYVILSVSTAILGLWLGLATMRAWVG